MKEILTTEQLRSLIQLAEDERAPVDAEAVSALNYLNACVQRNLLKRYSAAARRNESLSDRLERYHNKEKEKVVTGEFAETGLDSHEVARALLYQLQQLKTYKLTKSKVISVLYEMYASWLHSKSERLFLEHPVATEYGPQFWRVFQRLDVRESVPYQEYKDLAGKNPGVAAFCKRAAEKYYDYKDSDLSAPVLKSVPYKNASKENNGGKWNKQIEDRDIYAWKSDQKKG